MESISCFSKLNNIPPVELSESGNSISYGTCWPMGPSTVKNT